MRKAEIVADVVAAADISERKADEAVSAVFEQITNALARGETVSLVGFGSFTVKDRAARTGRHPQTGADLQISASRYPLFKAGKMLKDSVNK